MVYYGLIEENDNKVVSLLRRMLYLEKLTLYLRVDCQNTFTDPISLLNQFSMHMLQLRSFKFYLSTDNNRNDLVRYLSNNDLKQNSMDTRYQEMLNMASFTVNTAVYHIFTVPFEFARLMFIGNVFPNIIFNNVIELWIRDELPFKHEFFLRIAQAFPLLKSFYICYCSSLSCNTKKSSDNAQSHRIVEYPHLISLDISGINIDCVEQFLNETKTFLPRLAGLTVGYEELRIVTEDFTREATRRNCANITQLITRRQIAGSKDYYIYFPLL